MDPMTRFSPGGIFPAQLCQGGTFLLRHVACFLAAHDQLSPGRTGPGDGRAESFSGAGPYLATQLVAVEMRRRHGGWRRESGACPLQQVRPQTKTFVSSTCSAFISRAGRMAIRDRNPEIIKRFWNTVTPAPIKVASVTSKFDPRLTSAVRL